MRAPLSCALIFLGVTAPVGVAQITTAAPAPATAAVTSTAPAGIELRLVDPTWTPGRSAGAVTPLTTPAEILDPLIPAGERHRREAESRLNAGQPVGGAQRIYSTPAGTPTLRAWTVQFSGPAGARTGLEAMRWALRARQDTASQSVLDLPVPGASRLVVTRDRAGGMRTVSLVAIDTWVYGIESQAPSGQEPDPNVAALIGRLAARQPELAAVVGATGAEPVGVDDALRSEIGQVFSAARRTKASVLPIPGSTQAARFQNSDWEIARFVGASQEPLLFRRSQGGSWTLVGNVGGAGCPRVPHAVKTVWGLTGHCPLSTSPITRPDDPDAPGIDDSPFQGTGSWVWEVRRSGGTTNIIRQARRFGIRTVFVKSGDGTRYWRQFSQSIKPLKDAGLKVCGWQYIYGRKPVREARIAAQAVRAGADCFVVNAEVEFKGPRGRYNGRTYTAARRYMAELRRLVGRDYPVGMTSFAYVDYHPTFPYSAFFEPPNGAQVNMPQIYWGAFRQAVDRATRRTAMWNSIYDVPIAPIGGTYKREVPRDLLRFRCVSAAYGWPGASYWSFQSTRPSQWPSLGRPVSCSNAQLQRTYPTLSFRQHGDAVMWLQTRLRVWGNPVARTGRFNVQTRAAVRAFQRSRGLQVDGRAGPMTWAVLLEDPPPREQARR